ncbi:retrovirus-related pol polyprotein LINE-1, partial [Tanacetum coccineum]
MWHRSALSIISRCQGRIEALESDGNLRSCLSGQGGLGRYSESRSGRSGSRVKAFRRIRETKWKGSSNKEVNSYKLWYSGSHTARNGVGVILRACLKDKVVHVNRCSDKIISLTLVIKGETVKVINAYAPQVGGDLNGHIGATTEGYSGVHGGFGYGVRNKEGRSILDFATAHDLAVVNACFKKRDHHLITFQSGGRCTQIDYLLVRRGDLKACKDCKVFPGEACSSQHRLLAMDTLFKRVQRRRVGSAAARILDANSMWNFLASIIRDAAKDSLGEALGSSKTHTARRESWWLCEEVQSKVAEKQARFRELLSCQEGNLEERLRAQERYKLAKREAKKAVAQAKEKAYEDLYKKLDSKEGANEIFRIAKARQRRRRDLGDICFIKDEGGRTVTDEEEIKQRWGEYFSSLFNTGEPEGHEGVVDQNTLPLIDCYYSRISQTEVRTAVQKMGRNKAVGPDQIPIEAWRSLGAEGISWLTSLFNKIFTSAKMPEEWRLSDVIPIFKNKGDAQVCSNYRGIKLLSHTMKLWERVIERRLRRETSVSENQFGFMPGRSAVDAIHLIRSLMEKYRKRQRDLHIAFLDLEKAYDSVLRELIWKTLVNKGTSRRYIKVIRDMYDGAKTRVRTSIGNTEFFPLDVGLHQGSAISPYLFALILDELLRGIQEDIPWCLIFADDIVLVSDSAEGLNIKLENWREVLEDNGLRVSREKTEYLRCDFGNGEITHNEEVDIRIGDKILQPKESFRYLGSMLHKSGRIDEDVSNRIKAAWMKWRAATGVLCDRNVPLKLKGKFYRVAIRPAMLYGSECWPITKALANRVEVAELRMLRWTCGKTLLDMIPNGVYRAQLEVETIINKMREGRLRWFEHVRRRPQPAPVRRVEDLVVDGLRRRGRPKLRWVDRIKQDMKELLLSEDMTSDRNEWRARIRIDGCLLFVLACSFLALPATVSVCLLCALRFATGCGRKFTKELDGIS